MIALAQRPQNPAWKRLVNEAVSWWLGELRELIPRQLRAASEGGGRETAAIEFSPDGASVRVQARDQVPPKSIWIAFSGAQTANFDKARFAGTPVRIRLDDAFLFRPVVELPIAAERSLESILRHQLERIVPLDPDTLRFVWKIAGRDVARNRLSVELCIVKQATLDRATSLARELGLEPRSATVGIQDRPPATIWRSEAIAGSKSWEHPAKRALEIAAFGFAVSAYALLVWHLDARRAALHDLINELQPKTAVVQALAMRATDAEKTLANVRSRLAKPSPRAVLDALTQAIPLDGFVSELHLQGDKVEIVGTASHATLLLARIGAVPIFENPAFTAPVTAGAGGTGERYQLSFRVTGAGRP